MKIICTIPAFPKPSETFIFREFQALKDKGIDVRAVSVERPPSDSVLSDSMEKVMSETLYTDRARIIKDALLFAPRLLARPGRLVKSVKLAARLLASGTKPRSTFAILLKTMPAAREAIKWKADGIYGQWPYGSKMAAMCSAMTGLPYAFSVHAHEVAHDNSHFPVIGPGAEFITFCNRAGMEYAHNHGLEGCVEKSHLVYHGVDTDTFKPSEIPDLPPLKIISAGRLTSTKGFDLLLRSAAAAGKKGVNLEVTIVGDGQERERLDKLAHELGISDSTTIMPWMSFDRMPALYSQNHVFVLLASPDYNDGLPNVVLEAMSCGRPVILSPLPASREAVNNGEEGFILEEQKDLENAAIFIERLSLCPEDIKNMGNKARKKVERRFSEKSCVESLIELFRESFGEKG